MIGGVVLTAGRRPADLARAVESLQRQRGVELDLVVVGNGCDPEGVPDGVRVLPLERDEGIPAGRNAGAAAVGGELLFFLDDDCEVADADALARVVALLEGDPGLALVQLGPVARDPGGRRSRDWVPRLRVGDPSVPGESTVVWEGAVMIRRAVFTAVGGWPAEFRFVHEGVDLGWRIMDAGHHMRYAGDIRVLHPSPGRAAHGYSYYFGARNRVWLARRHLPLPLAVPFVLTFMLRTVPRIKSRRALQEAARGYRDGIRESAGRRRPLRAATLVRMARAGRPPII